MYPWNACTSSGYIQWLCGIFWCSSLAASLHIILCGCCCDSTHYHITRFVQFMIDHATTPLHRLCTVNSYSRLQRSCWCGAYAVWGWDNREAPLRLTCPPGGEPLQNTNAEFKAFDGSTNPYIGVAGIIIAGMLGGFVVGLLLEAQGAW